MLSRDDVNTTTHKITLTAFRLEVYDFHTTIDHCALSIYLKNTIKKLVR